MNRRIIYFLCLICNLTLVKAQQVIKLYEDGSLAGPTGETLTGTPDMEQVTYAESGEIRMITGVTEPSITVYLPDPAKATGTAVILCPGGGLRMLSWQNDAVNMARWLNERGIAAIGLKYRLRTDGFDPATGARSNSNGPSSAPQSESNGPTSAGRSDNNVSTTPVRTNANQDNPMAAMNLRITDFDKVANANANPDMSEASIETIDKAIADATEAIRLVRTHASEWHIDPDKVGFLGFSAGGGVALGAAIRAVNAEEGTMPDFIATAYGPSLIDVTVPDNAPGLFIATRADHPNVAAGLLSLFLEWQNAGASAEMYIYDDGRMGFGPDDSGNTSGTWRESFYRWLTSNGF